MRVLPLLASLLALPLAAQEPPPVVLDPVDIPVIDVEANVRRMLEEGRGQGDAEGGAAIDATPAGAAMAPAPVPVESHSVTPAPSPGVPVHATPAGISSQVPVPVPVPEKTITIRSVGDVKSLADELDQAKQRAQEKPVQ